MDSQQALNDSDDRTTSTRTPLQMSPTTSQHSSIPMTLQRSQTSDSSDSSLTAVTRTSSVPFGVRLILNKEASTGAGGRLLQAKAPWPTAIDPKLLQQTQIGTMIQPQNMTIVDQLQNNKSAYQEFDMGQFDEEDKQYMVYDYENKQLYDMRNDNHLLKLQDKQQKLISLDMVANQDPKTEEGIQANTEARKEWAKKKRNNNQDFLLAAESGQLEEVKKLLDKSSELGDLVADLNARGLDQWTALHFASNEGKLDIVNFLLAQPDIDIEATSTIGRTPLHQAAIRGNTDIVRALVSKGAHKNAADSDQNTALHHASEFGHFQVIIFLIKEAGVDPTCKNKFGYAPSDIAQNYQIRELFDKLVPPLRQKEDVKSQYGRTAFGTVLLHNDRINMVQKLMRTYQNVNKCMSKQPEEVAIAQEIEEKKKQDDGKVAKLLEKHEKKWKQKFIKIWQYTEQLESKQLEEQEQSVGPRNFMPIMKLGQGSFGQVFLCEKFTIRPDGSKIPTGKLYAMKILNKKQIMGNNLVKYAKTERDVLTYVRHPYIVGLKYAFQTPEKLFLLLDYAPCGNMSRTLHRDKRFDEERAKIYLAQILLAIEDLHKRDIIFRDLKPDNVVFDEDGNALLTDFGLSKEGIMNNSAARSFCGSPAYLAPEMLKRAGHGKSVDWYLLGVLLYEMLVGIPPYYSNNKEQLYENIRNGPLKLPNFLSQDAKEILIAVSASYCDPLQLLNRNPYKRLGAGKGGAQEIKDHPFMCKLNWDDIMTRKQKVPKPYPKQVVQQDIELEKVYGRGAFDESLKHLNRLNEWSFVEQKQKE